MRTMSKLAGECRFGPLTLGAHHPSYQWSDWPSLASVRRIGGHVTVRFGRFVAIVRYL